MGVKLNHTKFCRMHPICTYISKLMSRMGSLRISIESFNIILLHCLWLHIYSNRLIKLGRSKLGMYVKTWLPSNLQQQLIYSTIHLVIALSNKNSTFPRRHFWKRSHQSSLSVPLAATHHGCAIENESGLKKKPVVSRLHNSIPISRHFNAPGVISRQLNILCKYCTV